MNRILYAIFGILLLIAGSWIFENYAEPAKVVADTESLNFYAQEIRRTEANLKFVLNSASDNLAKNGKLPRFDKDTSDGISSLGAASVLLWSDDFGAESNKTKKNCLKIRFYGGDEPRVRVMRGANLESIVCQEILSDDRIFEFIRLGEISLEAAKVYF